MEIIAEKIDAYALAHSQAETDILKKLNRETHAKILMPRMLSGHMQGNLLTMLSKMIQPKQIDTLYFTYHLHCCLNLRQNFQVFLP